MNRTNSKALLICVIGFLALSVVPALASEVTGSLCTGINCPVEGTVIAAPTASPAAGTHTSAQSVTLTATGATSIRYTTDGAAPACPSTGTLYSSAISVGSSATIKAIACYANNASSTVASFAYTISIPVTTNSNSGGGGGSYVAPVTATAATTTTTAATPTATTPTTAATATATPTTATGAGSALYNQQVQLINLLILQLQTLLVQAKAQGVNLPAGTEAIIGALVAPATPSAGVYTFARSLEVGMTGADVKQLQIYLNTKGFQVAVSGAGSPGNETTYFGAGTRAALAKFQASVGITPAVGYFGPTTRAYVNSHP